MGGAGGADDVKSQTHTPILHKFLASSGETAAQYIPEEVRECSNASKIFFE